MWGMGTRKGHNSAVKFVLFLFFFNNKCKIILHVPYQVANAHVRRHIRVHVFYPIPIL